MMPRGATWRATSSRICRAIVSRASEYKEAALLPAVIARIADLNVGWSSTSA